MDGDRLLEGNEGNLRIEMSLPTLERLIEMQPSRLVLMTHLGDPDKLAKKTGRPREEFLAALDTEKVARRLSELWGKPVQFHGDIATPITGEGIYFLQNTRFDPREKKNDPGYAALLAAHAQGGIFVNDAFGAAHRAHASNAGVVPLFQGRSYIGLLMQRELEMLSPLLLPPQQSVALIGGLKIADKIDTITFLAEHYGTVLVGGAMVYAFLAAQEKPIGAAIVPPEEREKAQELIGTYGLRVVGIDGGKIVLPTDGVFGTGSAKAPQYTRSAGIETIEGNEYFFDIGEETRSQYAGIILPAEMAVWNGPMGLVEYEPFRGGTDAMVLAMAACEGISVAGGGETTTAEQQAELEKKIPKVGTKGGFSHVSTGGGATLAYLTGKELPSLAAFGQQ
ncbi:phosphoglycerate kinase [Candidatus Woesearchaeota archaeon CG_4_10_14_0_2_um_filter_57_5]|nr:MAG: phosphoglycerate kinase [Candidatus Woesearchaeota archaeon CG_4_10_14_0_2_um_filter_57_5]